MVRIAKKMGKRCLPSYNSTPYGEISKIVPQPFILPTVQLPSPPYGVVP